MQVKIIQCGGDYNINWITPALLSVALKNVLLKFIK